VGVPGVFYFLSPASETGFSGGAPANNQVRIEGKVEANSNPVKGATVHVFGAKTAAGVPVAIATVQTDENGKFAIDPGQFAVYQIKVQAPNYKPAEAWFDQNGLRGGELPIDLEPGDSASETPAHEGLFFDASRRRVFRENELVSLPLARSRSFDSFALLAPGVTPTAQSFNSTGPGLFPGIGTGGQFSVNGLRPRDNNFSIDGSGNNDEDAGVRRQGFVFESPQPPESIGEFQLVTGLPDVRFGRAIGAQVTALTRTGGTEIHGEMYGFVSDRRLNARNYFDQPPSADRSFPLARTGDGTVATLNGSPLLIHNPFPRETPYTQTNEGFTVGGPVHRASETFFFISFERADRHAGRQFHFAVPTVEQRGFSVQRNPDLASQAARLYPSSVAGNAIFSLFPFPNDPKGPYGANTFSTVLPDLAHGYLAAGKIEQRFYSWGAYHMLSGRYNFSNEDSVLPATGDALFSSVAPHVRTRNVAMYFTSTTSTSANAFRFSYGHAAFDFSDPGNPLLLPSSFSFRDKSDSQFLLNRPLQFDTTRPGVAPQPTLVTNSGFPTTDTITGPLGEVRVAGFSPLGADVYHFPQQRQDKSFEWGDIFTSVRGRHVLISGFDLWYTRFDNTVNRNARPRAEFFGERLTQEPLAPGQSDTQNSPALVSGASLVAAGVPSAFYQTLNPGQSNSLELHRKQFAFYAQDSYRITRNFQITLGLRFDVNHLPESTDGRFEQDFSQDALNKQLSQANGTCNMVGATTFCQQLINSLQRAFPENLAPAFRSRKSFDPRVGLAWDITGRGSTIVRGGFGRQTGQFPAIITDEDRTHFPRYLPLNVANFPSQDLYLFNLANPNVCVALTKENICIPASTVVAQGTLNTLTSQSAGDTLFTLARELTRLTVLTPTQPAQSLTNPNSLQYAMTLEHRFSWIGDFVGSVAYVGTQARHLLRPSTPDTGNNPGLSFDCVNNSNRTLINLFGSAGRLFPACGTLTPPQPPGVPGISRTLFETTANSSYNSVQAHFHGSTRFGIEFGSALTLSRAVDDASDFFDTAGSFALPQDSRSRSERTPSNFDVPYRFTGHFVWRLRAGRSLTGWRSQALGGWHVAGIYTSQGGQPYTVNTIYDLNRDGNPTDRLDSTSALQSGPIAGDRRILLQVSPGHTTEELLSQNALTASIANCKNSGSCDGSAGRNAFRGPDISNLDASAYKTSAFAMGKRECSWTLRADVFNLFNRTNFAIPVRILEEPGFGTSVATTTQNRRIQLALKLSF